MSKLLAMTLAAALLHDPAPSLTARRAPAPVDLEALSQGAQSSLDGVAPWAGVVTSSTGRAGWSVLNFYAYRVNGTVKLRARLSEGPFLGAGSEAVADAESCPQLRQVMLEAERVRLAPLHDDVLNGGSQIIILDGVRYRLWGQADGPMARTETSESDGGALAAYVKRARKALQGCWVKTAPRV